MAMWAAKRRIMYGGGVILVFLVIFVAIVWVYLYQAPTCFDGKMNGDEKGVDCGGSCKFLCTTDTLTPVVLWSKTFNISGDVYNAVALIENPNINSENSKAAYEFRIYDSDNRLITVKEGTTLVPKNKKFAVFVPGIILKNNKPKITDFKFLSFSTWEKNTDKEPEVSLRYGTVDSASTTPRLSGTITNKSIKDISRVELVAVLLDGKENAIQTSRTYIDDLKEGTSQDFIFTWQKPLSENVNVVNVLYNFVNQ